MCASFILQNRAADKRPALCCFQLSKENIHIQLESRNDSISPNCWSILVVYFIFFFYRKRAKTSTQLTWLLIVAMCTFAQLSGGTRVPTEPPTTASKHARV